MFSRQHVCDRCIFKELSYLFIFIVRKILLVGQQHNSIFGAIIMICLFSNISFHSVLAPGKIFCSFEIDCPVNEIKGHE